MTIETWLEISGLGLSIHMTISPYDIDTPALAVDEGIVRVTIAVMQIHCNKSGLKFSTAY